MDSRLRGKNKDQFLPRMITIKNLSKKFGSVIALQDLDLTINKGEFIFITGTSGSGKTTLLRLFTRDLKPDRGQLIVNGQDISKLKPSQFPAHRRHIGVVFQDFKLLSDLTIYENVALALRVIGHSRADIDKQVKNTLKLVGLTDRASLFPAQLAGGELQRACLARAVINHPPLLLADEPTGNLDPATSWQIMQLIKTIHRTGTTIIMATHNADIVNSMHERMIQLEQGKLVKDEANGTYEI